MRRYYMCIMADVMFLLMGIFYTWYGIKYNHTDPLLIGIGFDVSSILGLTLFGITRSISWTILPTIVCAVVVVLNSTIGIDL